MMKVNWWGRIKQEGVVVGLSLFLLLDLWDNLDGLGRCGVCGGGGG